MTAVRRRRSALFGVIALVAIGLGGAAHDGDAAQASVQRGRLHLIWDGGEDAERLEYFLQPLTGGPATRLRVPRALARSGQLIALDRAAVEVTLSTDAALRAGDPTVPTADLVTIRALPTSAQLGIADVASPEALDFVTVLCRFADDPTTPFTVGAVETVHGGSYPGLRYHFQEMAGDPAVMAGSQVVGWYTLPSPRSAYVTATSANYIALAQDCAGLAQGDVDLTQFRGVNLQLNGAMQTRSTPPYDTLSLGGSGTLTLNGVTRVWGITWLSGIHHRNYVVVHHEVGHAVGWPHSSGMYGQEYDSNWDLMSRGYLNYELPWGWRGIHTVAPHKEAVGWIPPERVLSPALGAEAKGRLVRSALPPGTGYLMVRVGIVGAGSWISAETRLPAGLDDPLPASSVLLHRVQFGIRSYVIDPDGNGNPNDAGAQWFPGEEYHDPDLGATIRVDSTVADGFDVTATRGWRLDATVVGPGEVELTPAVGPVVRCDSACASILSTRGLLVGVTAIPEPGRGFVGWSGGPCTGTGACNVALLANTRVVASFAGTPTITTNLLAATEMGTDYSDSLKVVNDGAPGTWSVSAGTLPPGLNLSATTGRITGVASAAGVYGLTLRVSAGSLYAEQATTITVTKPVLAQPVVLEALLGGMPLSLAHTRFLDLVGNRNGRLDVGDVRAWLLDNGVTLP